jgi:5-methylcytosine-specific restriction endonuclease McrBC regulatory subunit McrC
MPQTKKIVAKDCMPFYINGREECKNAIVGGNKCLEQFVASVIPMDVFGNELQNDDVDSKLAYCPIENKPYPLITDEGFEYKQVWQAGRYVGTVQIDGTTIEIKPRFGDAWLEYLLADVFHFQLTRSESKSFNKEKSHFNELMRRILWHMWIRKFASADKYGIPRRVVSRSYQGIQIRGHLNACKSIMPLFTKSQLISEYREKDIDNTICKIVFKAYCILTNLQLSKKSVPTQIQDSLNSLYSYYQGVPINVSAHDYQSVSYKSIYLSWKPLVDFSWQIIKQQSLFIQNYVQGESLSIFFDMAEIWEAFLRKKLGEGFSDDGWRVLSVEECHYRIYKGKFYSRDIIPDIILTRQNRRGENEYMVFDAKYKRMRANASKGYDVDRSDFFQIHTYINYVEHQLGHVVIGGLLYPLTKKAQDAEGNEVEVYVDDKRFHSEYLYGTIGRNEAVKTPFIIDGVYCPEEEKKYDVVKKDMGANVAAMIRRIKNAANL